MPLKIRLKPRQKFTANDCVMQNISKHDIELLILSNHKVTRENYQETSSGVKNV